MRKVFQTLQGGELMDDKRIVELFFERNENAIKETEKKYKRLLTYIAKNILVSDEDSEEIVNDAYLCAWSSIPPNKPNNLSAYLGKITRNLALDKLDKQNASKRGGTSVELIYDELENLISSEEGSVNDQLALKDSLNSFLAGLKKEHRVMFVQRYWYFSTIEEIAKNNGLKENNVKVILSRIRERLKKHLEKEGILI